MATDLSGKMGAVAQILLGDPNKAHSTKIDLRYGSKGSLSVDLRKGTFYDHEREEGGGVFDLIKRETGRTDGFAWLRENGLIEDDARPARPIRPKPKANGHANGHDKLHHKNTESERNLAIARRVASESTDIKGSPAQAYLELRGIDVGKLSNEALRDLRFHPGDQKHLPALIALVRDPATGELTGSIHRTPITADGTRALGKDGNPETKKGLGPHGSGMVCIGEVPKNGPIFLAEGIEDALTAAVVVKGAPAIATLGAGRMIKMHLEKGTKVVLLAQQKSAADRHNWFKAGQRFAALGCEVEVAWPGLRADINDLLTKDGPNAVEIAVASSASVTITAEGLAQRGDETKGDPPRSPLEVIDAFEQLLSRPAPDRRWHVEEGWIPANDVTLLGADGGEGKTTLGLQLAYCTVWGFPWLGLNVRQSPVVYITAEEPTEELHIRLDLIRKSIVLKGEPPYPLKIVSLADKDAVLALPGGSGGGMQTTPLFDEIVALVRDTEAKLLVLDAGADVFGGNEVDRGQVRSFIRILRSIALSQDCAVLLLAHPSVDGMKTGRGYSGSTHWNNAVRSRLYFTTPKKGDEEPDQDLRELERAKANRARRGVKIMLRWRDGHFAVEHGASGSILTLARAKNLFLELLRTYRDQGRNLSHMPGPSYAPTQMAKEDKAKAAGISKDLLAKAMNALFTEKRLKAEEYGKRSNVHTRLIEVSVGSGSE